MPHPKNWEGWSASDGGDVGRTTAWSKAYPGAENKTDTQKFEEIRPGRIKARINECCCDPALKICILLRLSSPASLHPKFYSRADRKAEADVANYIDFLCRAEMLAG